MKKKLTIDEIIEREENSSFEPNWKLVKSDIENLIKEENKKLIVEIKKLTEVRSKNDFQKVPIKLFRFLDSKLKELN